MKKLEIKGDNKSFWKLTQTKPVVNFAHWTSFEHPKKRKWTNNLDVTNRILISTNVRLIVLRGQVQKVFFVFDKKF